MIYKYFVILFVVIQPVLALAKNCDLSKEEQWKVEQINGQLEWTKQQANKSDSLDIIGEQLTRIYEQAGCFQQWTETLNQLYKIQKEIERPISIKWLNLAANQRWHTSLSRMDDSLLVVSLVRKGHEEGLQSRFVDAGKTYERALLICEQRSFQSNYLASYLYRPLGNIYTRFGDYERAINYLTFARDICDKDYGRLSTIVSDLGTAYRSSGDNKMAISIYENGLELKKLSFFHQALLLGNLAETWLDLGNLDQAIFYANNCLKVSKKLQEENQPIYKGPAYEVLGKVYAKKNLPEAKDYLLKALHFDTIAFKTTDHRQIAKTYNSIGNFYLKEGKFKQAADFYQSALRCLMPQFNPKDILENPTKEQVFAENSIYQALEGKAKVLMSLGGIDNSKKVLKTYQLILEVEDKLKQHFHYENSKLNLFQESRERNEKAIEVSLQLYKKTQKQQYVATAFQFAEHSKSAILSEVLATYKSAIQVGVPDSLLSKERTLNRLSLENQQRIAHLRGNSLDAKDSLNLINLEKSQLDIDIQQEKLKNFITANFPEYQKTVYQRPVISVDQIKTKLVGQEEAFIEYFFGKKSLYAFVITQNTVDLKELGNSRKLDKLIRSFKTIISDKFDEEKTLPDFGNQLYTALIQPLGLSETVEKLTIVPDGSLNYIPFQAFVMNTEKEQPDYLISRFLINYTYSGDILCHQLQSKFKISTESVLGIAPIKFADKKLADLPVTASFMEKLAKTHSGLFLTGKEATKQRFLEEAVDYQQLVLATHAVAGKYPGIYFADSVLTINDIYGLRLQASTAILMACGTADGILESGEGVLSLTRALTYAGVPSSTSSLWEVSEQSSSTIISTMMENLAEGLPKDVALRNAQLDFIENVSVNPWRWAAFIHVGDTTRVASQVPMWRLVIAGVAWMGVLVSGIIFLLLRKTFRAKNLQ